MSRKRRAAAERRRRAHRPNESESLPPCLPSPLSLTDLSHTHPHTHTHTHTHPHTPERALPHTHLAFPTACRLDRLRGMIGSSGATGSSAEVEILHAERAELHKQIKCSTCNTRRKVRFVVSTGLRGLSAAAWSTRKVHVHWGAPSHFEAFVGQWACFACVERCALLCRTRADVWHGTDLRIGVCCLQPISAQGDTPHRHLNMCVCVCGVDRTRSSCAACTSSAPSVPRTASRSARASARSACSPLARLTSSASTSTRRRLVVHAGGWRVARGVGWAGYWLGTVFE